MIDPLKEGVMDEEILKWKRKHPEAVRASMANPANYWNPPNTGAEGRVVGVKLNNPYLNVLMHEA